MPELRVSSKEIPNLEANLS